MVYYVIIYFIAISCIIEKFAKGYQGNTKENRRKRILLKYTTVNIDIPDIQCFPQCLKLMLFSTYACCERKFCKTGDILNVSRHFSTHE